MSAVRLNVGCGTYPVVEWLNLDVNPDVDPDVVADLRDLPADVKGLEQVYLGHVLHEIPPADVPMALTQLWERCVSGARICAVGPDLARAWDLIIAGQLDEDTARRFRAGGGWKWAPTEQRLLDLLRVSGLAWAGPVPIGSNLLDDWPVVSRAPWQCAIIGATR